MAIRPAGLAARLWGLVVGAALLLGGTGATAAESRSVEVDGTAFKVTLSDGRVLRSPDLVGAVLTMEREGKRLRLRIDAVERDFAAGRGEIWLHDLSIETADGSWRKLCEPGSDRKRLGFPLSGQSRPPDGHLEPAEPGVFEVACTSGAEGKCVRFGYLPWMGTQQLALYNACIHLVRADYCGDGTPHTRDGIPIEIYDRLGIRAHAAAARMQFEAAWGAEGAICVRRVRVPDIYSIDALRADCPQLGADAVGEGCTEEQVTRNSGVLLLNRSPSAR